MTYHPALEAECTECASDVALMIRSREKDLGEFSVRRVLPAVRRRLVGPFIFFDHMGPADFPPGTGISVRPHPHIGIATITYLFEGAILHRDSLGYVQPIEAGAVNFMTAGRGIVHSERDNGDRDVASRLHGIQSWMALPLDDEACDPSFEHYPAADIPRLEVDGAQVVVIIGEAFGVTSPVQTRARMLYLELRCPGGAQLSLPPGHDEMALYVVSGEVRAGAETVRTGEMAVFRNGCSPAFAAQVDSHVMVIGGEHVGQRTIDWNFVSSDPARIEQAKDDWRAQRFAPVVDDDEFIPLPD